MSDRTQIDEIKSKLDIVNIVTPYVPALKRSGRNYFGLCPFHKEKTPSFSVNPELGLFKCFGCGEGGDVIKFIEKIEGIDFAKALEIAGAKAGIKIVHHTSPQQQKEVHIKQEILRANSLSSEFFNYVLLKHPLGQIGRDYAHKRKLTKEIVKNFSIGLAPAGYENLKSFLIKKGFKENDLVTWGLLVEKNGKIYDKFRKRLMFPVIDHQGDVVGFSGRSIETEEKGPKYLNSPETAVYKKSKTLYGLFQAKESIRKAGFAILVEGNIDILSSHKAGVANIIAPLGTALTLEQIYLLKRYADTIYFALDTDNAGQKALLKDLMMIDQVGMSAFVLDINNYKDIDDLITNGGNWQDIVAHPVELVIYFLQSLQKKYDISKPMEKNKYIRQILEIISKIQNPLLINDYLNKLESVVNIDVTVLLTELNKIRDTLRKNNLNELPTDHKLFIEINQKQEQENVIYKYILALLLNNQKYSLESIKDRISEVRDLMPSPVYQVVFEEIISNSSGEGLGEEEFTLYSECALMPMDVFKDEPHFIHEVLVLINRLKKGKIINEIEEIKKSNNLDTDQEKLLLLKRLTKEIAKLK